MILKTYNLKHTTNIPLTLALSTSHLLSINSAEGSAPLSSSMGKMSGCLLGVGIVLTVAWSLIGLKV